MKKTVWLLALAPLLMFASCTKDSGSIKDNSIKASIDDTARTFNFAATATYVSTASPYSLVLYAGTGASSNEGVTLSISQTGIPITAGTYTQSGGAGVYVIGGVYNPGTTVTSEIYGAGFNVGADPQFTITITSISATNVTGTFSGAFYDNSGFGSNKKVFSNGQFNLAIQQ